MGPSLLVGLEYNDRFTTLVKLSLGGEAERMLCAKNSILLGFWASWRCDGAAYGVGISAALN